MRNVVITGANSGLGFQTSVALARTGARIVMACRSTERARRAERELLTEVPDASTIVIRLDVSEPESIRAFGEEVSDTIEELGFEHTELRYAGRMSAASPATGQAKIHAQEQKALVEDALEVGKPALRRIAARKAALEARKAALEAHDRAK